MKNTIKKIAATAMAFAILGSGTTAINTISSKSDNTLVASAHYYGPDGETQHTKNYTWLNSKKIGNTIYVYRYYGCDCGYTWRKETPVAQYRA